MIFDSRLKPCSLRNAHVPRTVDIEHYGSIKSQQDVEEHRIT